jgi:acetolactate synthase-1/2/3 large subunit
LARGTFASNKPAWNGALKVAQAIAQILKCEGIDTLIGYPRNSIVEACAEADIRTVMVRQERTGVHMADAVSRLSSGQCIGVFAMQSGPGTENSFGGVAQAFGDSAPILVLPGGHARASLIPPNFNAFLNFQHVTKWAEQITLAANTPAVLRRAFTQAYNGRPRPVLVETPADVMEEELPEPLAYRPAPRTRFGPDPQAVERVAEVLLAAERPVIYAGQGIHYARAWDSLREVAELLEAPVATSLPGKSAFPENHPLALGAGGNTYPKAVTHFLGRADVIFGIGCSFAPTAWNVRMPPGKVMIHATLDPSDLNGHVPVDHALVGDARLTLEALLSELKDRRGGKANGQDGATAREVAKVKAEWLAQWRPRLTSEEVPLSPYRVIWDLLHTVDVDNTIITHDAGGPRNQLVPFWEPRAPLSYIGWGKTTQLGTSLGFALGAKLARPDKLCIHVWGDAAIGFTGMDFETAVRERLPILSVLMNNSTMACELAEMRQSTAKYRSTDISGNYAAFAEALGGFGERVTEPGAIAPAIRRALRRIDEGQPALLEFITGPEVTSSR